MKLSIVTTLYRSEPYIEEFYRRSCAVAEAITDDFEIIYVNDGSPDNSLETAAALVGRDPRVRVVDLSRNFGHHKALMTGLDHAKGDLIFLLDVDLEEEPEYLPLFYKEMQDTGADAVFGVQTVRKGGWFERVTGEAFYSIFNAMSYPPLPRNLVLARLMTRQYVDALLRHREREILIAGLFASTGFHQVGVPVTKRSKGSTTYNIPRKLAILVNGIASYSNRPLVGIFHIGWIIMLLSSIAGFYLVFRRLFFQEYLAGWPSLIVSIWFLGGLTIFCLGIIGIYLSKIFIETKERPFTIVRKVYEHDETNHEAATR